MLVKLLPLILLYSGLYAGPPMLTNDPFVPDVNQFEINTIAVSEHRDTTIFTAPVFDLNYGVVKDVQVTLATGYISSDVQSGFDAFEVSTKWKFYSNETFAIALSPIYISYPLETVLNEGEVFKVSAPMSLTLTETLLWILSLDYIMPFEDDNHLEVGTYLQYTLEQHNFYAEVFSEESKTHDALFTLLNFGYLYQLDNNWAVMFSAGREIKAEEEEATIGFVGIQLVY